MDYTTYKMDLHNDVMDDTSDKMDVHNDVMGNSKTMGNYSSETTDRKTDRKMISMLELSDSEESEDEIDAVMMQVEQIREQQEKLREQEAQDKIAREIEAERIKKEIMFQNQKRLTRDGIEEKKKKKKKKKKDENEDTTQRQEELLNKIRHSDAFREMELAARHRMNAQGRGDSISIRGRGDSIVAMSPGMPEGPLTRGSIGAQGVVGSLGRRSSVHTGLQDNFHDRQSISEGAVSFPEGTTVVTTGDGIPNYEKLKKSMNMLSRAQTEELNAILLEVGTEDPDFVCAFIEEMAQLNALFDENLEIEFIEDDEKVEAGGDEKVEKEGDKKVENLGKSTTKDSPLGSSSGRKSKSRKSGKLKDWEGKKGEIKQIKRGEIKQEEEDEEPLDKLRSEGWEKKSLEARFGGGTIQSVLQRLDGHVEGYVDGHVVEDGHVKKKMDFDKKDQDILLQARRMSQHFDIQSPLSGTGLTSVHSSLSQVSPPTTLSSPTAGNDRESRLVDVTMSRARKSENVEEDTTDRTKDGEFLHEKHFGDPSVVSCARFDDGVIELEIDNHDDGAGDHESAEGNSSIRKSLIIESRGTSRKSEGLGLDFLESKLDNLLAGMRDMLEPGEVVGGYVKKDSNVKNPNVLSSDEDESIKKDESSRGLSLASGCSESMSPDDIFSSSSPDSLIRTALDDGPCLNYYSTSRDSTKMGDSTTSDRKKRHTSILKKKKKRRPNMSVFVHILEKCFLIRCGQGNQSLGWLAHAAILKLDPIYHGIHLSIDDLKDDNGRSLGLENNVYKTLRNQHSTPHLWVCLR